jgi:hypothetical protein
MSFEGHFWPWYLSQHRRPATRLLHALATLTNAACQVAAVGLRWPLLVPLGPLLDYAIAQLGHRVFEKNATRPWRHPLWHARAELRLLRHVACGAARRALALLDLGLRSRSETSRGPGCRRHRFFDP